ncbi:hypothetical protein DSECCO2_528480 [anaerobic digester metagenome]
MYRIAEHLSGIPGDHNGVVFRIFHPVEVDLRIAGRQCRKCKGIVYQYHLVEGFEQGAVRIYAARPQLADIPGINPVMIIGGIADNIGHLRGGKLSVRQ